MLTEEKEPTQKARVAFKSFDFRLLWVSALLQQVGQQMRQITNYYLVYQITGSFAQLGLTGLFQLIPMLILGLFGGTLADLIDKKCISKENGGCHGKG